MDERRTDTRARIRAVALDLFAEQGYEKTSLREIADRLGVTKAALYYHFKTKEDIVCSLLDDYMTALDGIIAWAKEQPHTMEMRRELVRRIAAVTHERATEMMRFFQENQPAVRELKPGATVKERFKEIAHLLTDPDAPLTDKIKARIALFALHAGIAFTDDLDVDDAERKAAALDVALEMVSGGRPADTAPPRATEGVPAR